MEMPGRDTTFKSSYRYGFNGKEMDNEPYGQSNEYDFFSRIYNPRIGRWFSTDPVNKPWLSPYQFGANNPINNIDADGSDEIHFHTYKTMVRRPDGVIVGQTNSSIIIIKDNGPDRYFFHTHLTRIETPGKFSKGGSSTAERTIEFYPWKDNSRSGITGTNVFGFITNRYWGGDRDYVTLIKLINENPELQSYFETKIKDKKWDWDDQNYKQILKDAPKFQTVENIKKAAEFTAAAVSVVDAGVSIVDASSLSKLAEPSGFGDLTVGEVQKIQAVVDEAGRPLEVGGSAAKGTRIGIGQNIPIQKGVKSDIDYFVPLSSTNYYKGLESELPDLDPKTGIIPSSGNPNIGPTIKFEPGAKQPTMIPAANSE